MKSSYPVTVDEALISVPGEAHKFINLQFVNDADIYDWQSIQKTDKLPVMAFRDNNPETLEDDAWCALCPLSIFQGLEGRWEEQDPQKKNWTFQLTVKLEWHGFLLALEQYLSHQHNKASP
ncbi:MAG: hypothetical protein AAGA46_00010 [Cyanobacteria bacterium P01_F01_bin.13]